METARVDEKGRILIPKSVREKAGVREGSYVKINVDEKGVVIEPLGTIADNYFGAFRVIEWPDDLDEFVTEVMRKWWARTKRAT